MKPITVWYARDPVTRCYCHNHIEDGHSQDRTPQPKYERQSVWHGMKWIKRHTTINDKQEVTP
jgi:hypothetical protein